MVNIALKSVFGGSYIYLRCEVENIYVFGDKKAALKFKTEDEAKMFIDDLIAKKLIKKHVAKDVVFTAL
jgi:hypothetical protein